MSDLPPLNSIKQASAPLMSDLLPLNLIERASAPPSELKKQFLRFSVGNSTALLPVPQLAEVLQIATDQIVPIPDLPTWVRGVYNWRGEILWMVNLGHGTWGMEQWHSPGSPLPSSTLETAIVIQTRGDTSINPSSQTLGLMVDRVEDIEWCPTDSIEPLPAASEIPFLRGHWIKPTGERLAIFDGEAIIAAMPKAS